MTHLDAARQRLDVVKGEKQERITVVLLTNDEKERERREKEDRAISIRQQNRESEQDETKTLQAKAEMRAYRSKEKTDPASMKEEMEQTKVYYETIIESKDNLIIELKNNLTDKDRQYMKSLQTQRQDIENMLQTMKETYSEIVQSYQDELEKLESIYDKERGEQLETFHGEVDSLLDKRRKTEVAQLDTIRSTREVYGERLEKQRQRAIEQYNELNTTLENEIQDLEQQHAAMRNTVQLNQQKLQYDVKVLAARAKENSLTKSTQQAKAARVSEALTSIKEKLKETTTMYQTENQRLTEEYKRVTENFKELQSKFRHFELTDEKQFQELYAMHEENILGLARKVLQADKIITEQQLGLEWEAPVISTDDDEEDANEDEKEEEAAKEDEEREERKSVSSTELTAATRFPTAIRQMLSMIVDECGFLAVGSEGVPQQTNKHHRTEEEEVLMADAILNTLNVRTPSDLNRLFTYFVTDPSALDEDRQDDEEGAGTPQAPDEAISMIEPSEVVNAMKAFASDMNENKPTTANQPNATQANPGGGQGQGGQRGQHRQIKKKVVYWGAARQVIPDEQLRMWEILENAEMEYTTLLHDRQLLIEKANALREQNQELKTLLNSYLSRKINEELIHPPQHVLEMTEQVAPEALPHYDY
ncbi:putative Dynein regulatory complex protein 1 [Blattamonas nauphoetae]|uniref:Dynein regulatory complex protein 1 n=1 Tax=Blattamonas nauphoetae TaxID=2049346 RepID=A0ABQ9XTA9_9EUKA|nr:putative Dynein regulatory complex protein 1 [Blattamonas nauphoetae]